MAEKLISAAKQTSSSTVTVYDINGSLLFTKSGTLVGFTSTTVAVQEGSTVKVYDNKGSFKFSK